jgi:hypothetical protein
MHATFCNLDTCIQVIAVETERTRQLLLAAGRTAFCGGHRLRHKQPSCIFPHIDRRVPQELCMGSHNQHCSVMESCSESPFYIIIGIW